MARRYTRDSSGRFAPSGGSARKGKGGSTLKQELKKAVRSPAFRLGVTMATQAVGRAVLKAI